MPNLTQITLQKIEELGLKAAAEYFDKSEVTIRGWAQKKRVPAEAAQKVLDDRTTTEVESSGAAEAGTTIPIPVPQSTDIIERIALIESRLARLEFKVESPTHTSVVPPQKQPNWTSPHNFRR